MTERAHVALNRVTAHGCADGAKPAERFGWERLVREFRFPGRPASARDQKLVALTLATYADADGSRVRPGVSRLAEDCLMGESTVRRYVQSLVDLGFLKRLSNGGGRAKLAASYRLTSPASLSPTSPDLGSLPTWTTAGRGPIPRMDLLTNVVVLDAPAALLLAGAVRTRSLGLSPTPAMLEVEEEFLCIVADQGESDPGSP